MQSDTGELKARYRMVIAKFRDETPQEQTCVHWRKQDGEHCGHFIEEIVEEGEME